MGLFDRNNVHVLTQDVSTDLTSSNSFVSNINTVANNNTNITTVANNIEAIQTIAENINALLTLANSSD